MAGILLNDMVSTRKQSSPVVKNKIENGKCSRFSKDVHLNEGSISTSINGNR